uniref:Uncharacterized protein n=1 Tax=Myripristis murdjan TaxID=586833 RepID=A0A667WZ58_9TELE
PFEGRTEILDTVEYLKCAFGCDSSCFNWYTCRNDCAKGRLGLCGPPWCAKSNDFLLQCRWEPLLK